MCYFLSSALSMFSRLSPVSTAGLLFPPKGIIPVCLTEAFRLSLLQTLFYSARKLRPLRNIISGTAYLLKYTRVARQAKKNALVNEDL